MRRPDDSSKEREVAVSELITFEIQWSIVESLVESSNIRILIPSEGGSKGSRSEGAVIHIWSDIMTLSIIIPLMTVRWGHDRALVRSDRCVRKQ